jgi:hypothetical protein
MTIRTDSDAPDIYILPMRRRQKKQSAAAADFPRRVPMTISFASHAIWIAAAIPSSWSSSSAASTARGAA